MPLNLEDLYHEIRDLHTRFYTRLKQETETLVDNLLLTEVADNHFMVKQCEQLLDDMCSECVRFEKNLSGVACLKAQATNNPIIPQGKMARAYIRASVAAKIPSYTKDPQAYKEMCAVLGVPFDPNTRLHWPSIKKHMTDILNEKGVLPPELQPYQAYSEAILVTSALSGPQAEDFAQVPEYLQS